MEDGMFKTHHTTWVSVSILALLFTFLGIYYPELQFWDQAITDFVGRISLEKGNSPPFVFVFLNWWGTKGGMFFISTIGVGALIVLYRRLREGWLLAGGMVSGWAFLELSKLLFHRRRPGGTYLFPATGYSFPSGHAFITLLFTILFISLSLPLLHCPRYNSDHKWLKVILFISYIILGTLTVATGWSRIYFGMHYPTDVLGGWLAGAFWAALYKKYRPSA